MLWPGGGQQVGAAQANVSSGLITGDSDPGGRVQAPARARSGQHPGVQLHPGLERNGGVGREGGAGGRLPTAGPKAAMLG